MNAINIKQSSSDVIQNLNSNMTELLSKWECRSGSFRSFTDGNANKEAVGLLNANLRQNLVKIGMSGYDFCDAINAGFNSEQRRYQDYRKKNAIPGTLDQMEPTAIVSVDGNKLELWCTRGYTYTTDGINFSEWQPVSYEYVEDYPSPQAAHYFYYNGELYSVSAYTSDVQGASKWDKFLLWKQNSQNPYYFDFVQVLFVPGGVAGNPFLFEESGTWYLIYEGDKGSGWKTYLASASRLTGQYADVQADPIINDESGNPELIMMYGKPVKIDGKYFLFYHHKITTAQQSIRRASSLDLIHWNVDGPMLDGRFDPSFPLWTCADQALCEFKGHSYLFVCRDANSYLDPHPGYQIQIDMFIDYRPLSEILRLQP